MNLDLTPLLSGRVESFALLFVRVTALLATMPLLSSGVVPVRVRVLLGVAVAAALLPLVPASSLARFTDTTGFLVMVGSEVMVGALLGLFASAALFAVQIAGELLGLQIGFGISNLIDPMSETQTIVTTQLLSLFFLLVFLVLNGHHLVLRALGATLDSVPLGGFSLAPGVVEVFVRELSAIFEAGFRVGAPVMAFLFVSSMALGIVSKTLPQVNVFVIGFPIKIIGALLVLLMTLPSLRVAFGEMTARVERDLAALVRAM